MHQHHQNVEEFRHIHRNGHVHIHHLSRQGRIDGGPDLQAIRSMAHMGQGAGSFTHIHPNGKVHIHRLPPGSFAHLYRNGPGHLIDRPQFHAAYTHRPRLDIPRGSIRPGLGGFGRPGLGELRSQLR